MGVDTGTENGKGRLQRLSYKLKLGAIANPARNPRDRRNIMERKDLKFKGSQYLHESSNLLLSTRRAT